MTRTDRITDQDEPVRLERRAMEVVLARANWLDADDRALVIAFLSRAMSLYQLARLSGTSVSTIGRRVRRIIRRLRDDTYSSCLERRRQFSDLELEIIRDHFIRGLSMRRIGEERRLCYYRVRAAVLKARRTTRCGRAASQEEHACRQANTTLSSGSLGKGR